MKHGSLFSGIGGFDLAAEWMGWESVFHCENNEFCQKILKYYWPYAQSYNDIKETDFTEWRGKCDIVSGGFPCQPYSQAGKRKGKEDDRHLWPEMLRAIKEIQPSFVVGENVPGLLNWKRGMVLAEICADLEAAGFEVFPPLILPACGKNAPHRRDRLWIVAHSINGGYRIDGNKNEEKNPISQISREAIHAGLFDRTTGEDRIITNSNSNGLNRSDSEDEINASEGGFNALNDAKQVIVTDTNGNQRHKRGLYPDESEKAERQPISFDTRFFRGTWENFPTVSPLRDRDDGFPSKLVKQSIQGLGNAIVPQIAYEIFKAIEQTIKT